MKNAKFFAQSLLFLAVSGFSFSSIRSGQCAGLVVWPANLTAANSVVDANVYINNPFTTIADNEEVCISAKTCDITVEVAQHVNMAGQFLSCLCFEVEQGHTITVAILNGSLDLQNLEISVRGAGAVIFQIEGGNALNLLQNVCLQVDMTVGLQLCFERPPGEQPATGNLDALVAIGSGSELTYTYPEGQPAGDGCIKWDTTNLSGSGRLVLLITDKGTVTVQNCYWNTDIPAFECDSGSEVAMKIVNNSGGGAPGGLLVLNRNATWPDLLIDPFCNLGARDDLVDYRGSFTGNQYGFILGANGTLDIGENAYLDYVGLTGTVCVDVAGEEAPKSLIKPRTPSALIIDGSHDPSLKPAKINLANQAAIYFRSGVDNTGAVRPISDPHPFTIDPLLRTPGAGLTVMHIEGQLDVCGTNTSTESPDGMKSMMEVLSLEVGHTGGPLFVGTNETIFPLRTFAKDGMDQLYQYNAANIMVNNCWNLFNAALKHTDKAHKVIEKNDACSEPTYIGGETAVLKSEPFKERLSFHNSVFLAHTDAAFTGFDLSIPNGIDPETSDCVDNLSRFHFFHNGKRVDQGTGRQMILGTLIGSTACDGCTVVCRDAHLDVMQASGCMGGDQLRHELQLKTQANDDTINYKITGDIEGQTAIHSIYLGGNSNISVGTSDPNNSGMGTDKDGDTFSLTTLPKFTIYGNFFSFETKGGSLGLPSTSSVSGQGGIFVDKNGTFCLADGFRAYFGTMLTKSSNGIVDVPKECSLFEHCLGVADWNLDLSSKQMIVPHNIHLSDYTLNWMFVKKDYDGGFCPYETTECGGCDCTPVLDDHIFHLPEIRGTIDQLQIKGSRLGDQAHIFVNGGHVRELVHCVGFNSAEAPVAVVVLDNGGRVGIGSTSSNADSLRAHSTLGVNGVTIIANGGGVVELNDNLVIDNHCSILAGPGFTAGGSLRIGSTLGKTLTIKSTGVLDLRSFTLGQDIEFFGDLEVVLEPGARILFGGDIHTEGNTLRFAGNTRLLLEPAVNPYNLDSAVDLPESTLDFVASCIDNPLASLTQSNHRRVIMAGAGKIEFANCASMSIPRGAALGIETYEPCDVAFTDIVMEIKNNARVVIGDERVSGFGGCMQIGNVTDHRAGSISFNLILNGSEASFEVGAQGFLGLAVGCVCKLFTAPNNWQVAPLHNVDNIDLTLTNGIFKAAHIWPGSDELAGLIAMSEGASGSVDYTVNVSPIVDEDGHLSRTSILGGMNIVNIDGAAGVIHPVVLGDDGTIDANYQAGILASSRHIVGTMSGSSAANVFDFVKLGDLGDSQPVTGSAVAAQNQKNHKLLNAGWISNGKIGRESFDNMVSTGGKLTAHRHTKETGSITMAVVSGLTSPSRIRFVVENS